STACALVRCPAVSVNQDSRICRRTAQPLVSYVCSGGPHVAHALRHVPHLSLSTACTLVDGPCLIAGSGAASHRKPLAHRQSGASLPTGVSMPGWAGQRSETASATASGRRS